VLVDSEGIANRIFADSLAEAGYPLGLDEVADTFVGLSLDSCFAALERRFGRPEPPGFRERLQQRTYAAFRADLGAVPGVADAIDAVEAAGLATCVASSGDHAKMRVSLGATGLWDRFEGRIFSATEVPRGKPHPDLFLYAARRMGVAPADAVVVEDSRPGVRAAVAAGMRAIGYVGGWRPADLAAEGAEPLHDMARLPDLLGIRTAAGWT
jgi:HAD superfamily hydrolase (TIGR01509 family)